LRRRSFATSLGFFLVCCCFFLPVSKAAKIPQQCGPGVALKLSAPASTQGSLLLLEVQSKKPIDSLSGGWNGRELAFWQAGNAQPAAKTSVVDRRRALLGVDLEKAAGSYTVSVSVQTSGGKPTACTLQIPIRRGKFAVESLHVESEFVEPNPEQVKRANAERDRLREIFDHVTPQKLWEGKFRVPLDGVSTGGNFGKRRILNGKPGSPHGGVDFPVVTGTPVHAPQAGRVVLAEELFFSGNTVVLDHGLGIYTFYGHLSAIDVKAGDDVRSGQILGKVGATGRVTGPHLHWGLTIERARVNPLQLVALLQNE